MITLNPLTYQGALATNTPTAATTAPTTTDTNRFADQLLEATQQVAPSNQSVSNLDTAQTALPVGPTIAAITTETDNSTPGVSAAIKNFIEWQGVQPNPFGQGTIADVWAKQGITDPLSNPVLIGQAETQLNRAEQRSAMNPNYVAEWQGDWKTQMAQAKASENQRQTFLAAADALGKVTVGGGIASMVG
jgi:hypothetical protein